MLKVQPHAAGLCASCSNAHVAEFENGEVETWCKALPYHPRRITRIVVRCNDYEHAFGASLYEMKEIAWALKTDTSGRIAGFVAPDRKKVRTDMQSGGIAMT